MKQITVIVFLFSAMLTAGSGAALADTVRIDLDSLCPTAGDLCPIPASGVVLHDFITLESPDGARIFNNSDTPLDASLAFLGEQTAIFTFDTSQARVSEISFSGSPNGDGGTLTYIARQSINFPITVAENADFDASISAATGDMFTSLTLASTIAVGTSPEPFARDFVITYTPVPVPPAVWLMVSGLIGLVGIARRKRAG